MDAGRTARRRGDGRCNKSARAIQGRGFRGFLASRRGAIIELDATEDDEVRILANNFPVATGIVVVQGNRIAVEIKELLPRSPDGR